MMAVSSIHCLALAALVIVGIVIFGDHVSAQDNCDIASPGQLQYCLDYTSKYVSKDQKPSEACCDVMKKTDILCVCKTIPEIKEQQLSMENVINVARFCQVPVPPPGNKCGSYIIQPPLAP
ncbi:hypothetical protein NE237_003426 [Protea cynaroides]|uniref:Bifunctional inhibitor/plant lipid transfer protein/seed storage helical domain-containing protein n=1 Tax=Protea cynaroides TaxID=273540 RepID=A0A9Q0KGZ4_9MAGN|nr:hypothetical protein NE237_003426 [Protea cynaroides]